MNIVTIIIYWHCMLTFYYAQLNLVLKSLNVFFTLALNFTFFWNIRKILNYLELSPIIFTIKNLVKVSKLFLLSPCCCMEETKNKSSHPEVFLGKVVLKLCSKFTGEHPCQSAISVKLLCNFIEITLQHGFRVCRVSRID